MITVPGIPTLLLSYREWEAQQKTTLQNSHELIRCPDCDGFGDSECECCGAEAECGTCFGSGEVECTELSPGQRSKLTNWAHYVDAITHEVRQLYHWLGRDFATLKDELNPLLKEYQTNG